MSWNNKVQKRNEKSKGKNCTCWLFENNGNVLTNEQINILRDISLNCTVASVRMSWRAQFPPRATTWSCTYTPRARLPGATRCYGADSDTAVAVRASVSAHRPASRLRSSMLSDAPRQLQLANALFFLRFRQSTVCATPRTFVFFVFLTFSSQLCDSMMDDEKNFKLISPTKVAKKVSFKVSTTIWQCFFLVFFLVWVMVFVLLCVVFFILKGCCWRSKWNCAEVFSWLIILVCGQSIELIRERNTFAGTILYPRWQ